MNVMLCRGDHYVSANFEDTDGLLCCCIVSYVEGKNVVVLPLLLPVLSSMAVNAHSVEANVSFVLYSHVNDSGQKKNFG